LVRYPELQPLRPDSTPGERRFYDSWRQSFEGKLAESEETIRARAKSVLSKLTVEQRRQVAALCAEIIDEFKGYAAAKPDLACRNKRAEQAQRLDAQYRKKVSRFIQDLKAMRADDETVRAAWHNRVATIEQCLTNPDNMVRTVPFNHFRRPPGTSPESPCPYGMVQLFSLLHDGFALSVGEAEVRVAVIRNKFWAPRVETVKYNMRPKSLRGCDAVRKAVERDNAARSQNQKQKALKYRQESE
jgi:hypothetical protein